MKVNFFPGKIKDYVIEKDFVQDKVSNIVFILGGLKSHVLLHMI